MKMICYFVGAAVPSRPANSSAFPEYRLKCLTDTKRVDPLFQEEHDMLSAFKYATLLQYRENSSPGRDGVLW